VWDAPRASLGTDVRTFRVSAAKAATRLRVAVMFPSEAVVGVGVGLTEYSVVVEDAKGKVLVDGTTTAGIGTATALVRVPAGATGPYQVTVTGDQSVSDPDGLDSDSLLGDTVTVSVVQAAKR
jgi:serine protease AprX